MYKIILTIFFSINIVLSAKGNYDEAKFRSDLLRNSVSWVGTPYLWGGNSKSGIDCSHFVNQVVLSAGMNGVTGKNYITTAGMRSSGLNKNISCSDMKPGDMIVMGQGSGPRQAGHVMMVYSNPGNGKIEVIDSSASKGVKKRVINCPVRRYAGTISATDILISNGYTPVNSDGTVIPPPLGAVVGSSGSYSTSINLEEKYNYSWEEYQEEFLDMINEGVSKLKPLAASLLAVLTVIQLLLLAIPYLFSNEKTNYLIKGGITAFKFSYLLYIINNFETILELMYNFFSGIGFLFLKDSKIETLDALFASSWKEATKILSLINDYNLSWYNIIIPSSNLFDENFYKVFVLFLIFILLLFVSASILFNLIAITVSFFLGNGLSPFNLSFGTLDIFRQIGDRPLKTMIATGIRLTFLIVFLSLIYTTMEKVDFGSYTLETITFEVMFSFIVTGALLSILLFKFNNIVDNI